MSQLAGDFNFKAMNGQVNVDEAQGIVECFVAAVGNKDSVGDIVATGAFTESLKRRKPRVVWGHNWNDPIGKVLEIYEVPANDPRLPGKMKQSGVGGLYARVQFNLATEKGREAFSSVAFFGGDQEWSIGYKTINATYDQSLQANILREVELYEVSPVLHGANQLTATISVKSDEAEKCHPGMGPMAASPMSTFGPVTPPKLTVMRAFNPNEPEERDPRGVSPIEALLSAVSSFEGDREDIFAEGEAQMLGDEARSRLEQEVARRSSSRVEIISATENMIIMNRFMEDGKKVTYRLPYHHEEELDQYMFGKPEKLNVTKPGVTPQMIIPSQMPHMPMAVKPMGTASPYVLSANPGKSAFDIVARACKSIDANIFDDEQMSDTQKLLNIISILQEHVVKQAPNHAKLKCAPHQAYSVKQLLDPVLEYHELASEVHDDGIYIHGIFTDDAIDALKRCEKSIKASFKTKSSR